jgi:hypothetical protein
VISARSRSSKSESWRSPASTRPRIAGDPQAAHPADPASLPQALDAGGGEHPPVTHEDDVGEPEAGPQLLDRCLDGGGIGGVAGEGLDRDDRQREDLHRLAGLRRGAR